MSSMLFLNNLKAVCHENTNKCQIKIVTLYREYAEFELYACDKEGNLQSDKPVHTVDRADVQNQQNSIWVQRDKQKSLFFKVVPVIKQPGGEKKRLQMESEEKGNLVAIPVIKRQIFYQFNAGKVQANRGGILKKILPREPKKTTLNLSIQVAGNEIIQNGELCYVINQMRYPLPAITGSASYEIPNVDSSVIPVVQAVENPERYSIQLLRGV